MAIDFIVGDKVVVNNAFVVVTLAPSVSLIARNAVSALGLLGSAVSTVAEVGNFATGSQILSFIRVVPINTGMQSYNDGRGIVAYFESDAQLNNSFELSTAFFPDVNTQRVFNNTVGSLPKGSLVYNTGFDVTQQLATVALASAAAAPTAFLLGILLETIPAGETGACLTQGAYQGLDTSTGTINQVLFLSNTPGAFALVAGVVTAIVGRIQVVGLEGTIFIAGEFPLGQGSGGGLQGVTGLVGGTGIQGFTGISSGTGIQGLTGVGTTGISGTTGIIGFPGVTGLSLQGVTGLAGPGGAQGATGVQGLQGDTGVQGAAGVTGLIGSTGIQGLTGILGASVQGVTGLIGSTGVVGVGGVTGLIGSTGVVGVGGVTGLIGATGVAGVDGVTGLIGSTGVVGVGGVTGLIGSTGVVGVDGVTGLIGATGVAGVSGVTGLIGSTGVAGVTGLIGLTGIQGITGIGVAVSLERLSTTVVNMITGGATEVVIFTQAGGGLASVITEVVVRLTAASAIAVVPTVGAGFNAVGADNVYVPVALTGVTAVNDIWTFSSTAKAVYAPSGAATLLLGIDTGATGTTMLTSVDVIGYRF